MKSYDSLNKMVEYIDRVENYTNEYDFENFSDDIKTIDATIFAISQIGECVKNVPENIKEKYDNIDWRVIQDLRNRIVHDYEGINLKIIWYVIKNDLKQLKLDLKNILKEI